MILSILLHLIANFFTGAFVCNSIPHIVCGLRGEPFPTPFGNPPGRGLSSPIVNFLWGFFNLVVAFVLVCFYRVEISFNTGAVLFLVGFFLIGVWLSIHFGKVRTGSQGI